MQTMKEGMRFKVHRGQALLLVVVAGLAAAVVGVVALEGTGIPASVAARTSSGGAASRGVPGRITISDASQQAGSPGSQTVNGSAGSPSGPAVTGSGAGTAPPAAVPATVVPSTVYTYPSDDHGHDGATTGTTTTGSGGGSDSGSGSHHG
jgi:hypothetical protein